MPLIERLIADLHSEGTDMSVAEDGSACLIHRLHGVPVEPPMVLALAEEELQRHLATLADDAVEVFSDVGPAEAAYRLFLVHLDEVFAMQAMPSSVISLTAGGLQARPARPDVVIDGLTPGERYEWTSRRPE
jgi:hypothetical protein